MWLHSTSVWELFPFFPWVHPVCGHYHVPFVALFPFYGFVPCPSLLLIFFSRWTLSSLSRVLSFCGVVFNNRASCLISCVRKNTVRLSSTCFQTSKIDNLSLFLQLLSQSILLLFREISMLRCCCSSMSLTVVLILW